MFVIATLKDFNKDNFFFVPERYYNRSYLCTYNDGFATMINFPNYTIPLSHIKRMEFIK